jgi:hypothetical protein
MRAGRTAVGVCRHINHRECGVVNIVNIVSIVSRRFFQRVIRRFFGGEQHDFDFSARRIRLAYPSAILRLAIWMYLISLSIPITFEAP